MIYDELLPAFSRVVASRALVLRYVLMMFSKWLGSVALLVKCSFLGDICLSKLKTFKLTLFLQIAFTHPPEKLN